MLSLALLIGPKKGVASTGRLATPNHQRRMEEPVSILLFAGLAILHKFGKAIEKLKDI
jgi:hypothetical protein